MRRGFLCAISIILVPFFACAQQIQTTGGLLKEMHLKYHGKFFNHITYVQLNKFYQDGVQTEASVWYEAFEYPGKLRVDYGPTVGKDGYIFLNDSIFYFQSGILDHKEKKINETMLLQGDVYCLPIPTVLEKLKALGYDITKFREDTWNNNPVFVVGADKGDMTSRQFWIDKEFLYVVRQIVTEGDKALEVHFTEHAAKGKFYIEDEVRMMENGKLVRTERYAEVNHEITLNPSIFNPKEWGTAHWKKGGDKLAPK